MQKKNKKNATRKCNPKNLGPGKCKKNASKNASKNAKKQLGPGTCKKNAKILQAASKNAKTRKHVALKMQKKQNQKTSRRRTHFCIFSHFCCIFFACFLHLFCFFFCILPRFFAIFEKFEAMTKPPPKNAKKKCNLHLLYFSYFFRIFLYFFCICFAFFSHFFCIFFAFFLHFFCTLPRLFTIFEKFEALTKPPPKNANKMQFAFFLHFCLHFFCIFVCFFFAFFLHLYFVVAFFCIF